MKKEKEQGKAGKKTKAARVPPEPHHPARTPRAKASATEEKPVDLDDGEPVLAEGEPLIELEDLGLSVAEEEEATEVEATANDTNGTAQRRGPWHSPVYKAHLDSPHRVIFFIGRAMAYAEAIHSCALSGEAVSSIVKNLRKASTSPQSRWPRVSALVQQSYLKAIGSPKSRQLATIFMSVFTETTQELTEIPDYLDLDQQSAFWLGWYDGVRSTNYTRYKNTKLPAKAGASAAAAAPN